MRWAPNIPPILRASKNPHPFSIVLKHPFIPTNDAIRPANTYYERLLEIAKVFL